MNVSPIGGLANLSSIGDLARLADSPIGSGKTNVSTDAVPFKDMLQQAFQAVEETQQVSQEDSKRLAVGEIDNLFELGINSQKADIAVRMMVSIRNSVLDAYQEIMRINV